MKRQLAISFNFIFTVALIAAPTAHGRMMEGSESQKYQESVEHNKNSISSWGWSRLVEKAKEVVAQVTGNETVNAQPMKVVTPNNYVVPAVPFVLAPQVLATKVYTIDEKEKTKLASQLPSYQVPKKEEIVKNVSKMTEQYKSYEPMAITKGRAADKNLDRTKSGVAYVKKEKLITLKSIPRLDIGEEDRVAAKDLALEKWKLDELNFAEAKAFSSPAVLTDREFTLALGEPVLKVDSADKMQLLVAGEKTVTLEQVEKLTYVLGENAVVTEKDFKKFTDEEMKALRAQILFEHGDKCHVVSGILFDLTKSKTPSVQAMSNFYLGTCAHKMGLFSESIQRLLRVIKAKDEMYFGEAVTALLEEVPYEFEKEVGLALNTHVNAETVSVKQQSDFHYVVAKALYRDKKYSESLAHAEKVTKESKRYLNAQYLASLSEYATGSADKAMQRQLVISDLAKKSGDNNIQSLIAMNLARTSFQNRRYKDSIENFLKIGREHPLWVQGLQEQAWTQLLSTDQSGAIGNMHSIQSPFFKSVYMPESYAISAIGYLNLCQYGDAYRQLSVLEKNYRPILNNMESFLKTQTDPMSYYTAVIKFLRTPKAKEMDGLPAQVIREIARYKDFLNVQQAVNNRIDEDEQYAFIEGLIKKDKEKVAALQKRGDIKLERDQVAFNTFLSNTYEEGRLGLLDFRKVAQVTLKEHRTKMQVAAGQILKDRIKKLVSNLNTVLDNSELLRYEVFAGSGENIRYHATGGATGSAQTAKANRVPASAKPEKRELQWSFDGEFWEDEIGHYRSSLKNNCPQS